MQTDLYDFKAVESKWQKIWEGSKVFQADDAGPRAEKFYCLVMFPYPSGKIHMGHARNYCIGDVIARFKKMKGFNVLHPIGWDAFGLPAENAAIQHGIHPGTWTKQNIKDMRQDIKSLGISYDWTREFATCDPEYYRWDQWLFVKMFEKGLAYRKKSAVNWCPECLTVLANEQVHDGKCWRCASLVIQKDLDQWFFKITAYAERLLEGMEILKGKWPDEVLTMQRNWIGKSVGAEVVFKTTSGAPLTVFTTRPDTLFGCTFLVLSPENPMVKDLLSPERKAEAEKYIEKAKHKSRLERLAPDKEKTGVFTGSHAVNPVNGSRVPIWIADYVLSDYGTGAIMAVPAHDQRDFEFAKKFGLEIVQVIEPKIGTAPYSTFSKNRALSLFSAFEGDGVLINSGEFTGLDFEAGKKKITEKLEKSGQGKEAVTFRLRDWLLSRQRFWGTPIPIVFCEKCGAVPVKESDLPILLPEDVKFTGKGEAPLAQVPEFVNALCPKCGGKARRETDTMDTFVDSSWYYARYCDPGNERLPVGPAKADAWLPVNQYIGGIEHACMHLIYSRFFHKVMKDLGLVKGEEPFENLLTQGMVTMGGSAMSKSKGNAVPVEEMARRYGADTARVFVLFASPPRNQLEWSEDGVQGSFRFLNRIWRLGRQFASQGAVKASPPEASQKLLKKTHQTIKKVGEDLERDFQFNTAISALMELLNALSDHPAPGDAQSKESFRILAALLFPFAPHLASEIWQAMGFEPRNLNEVRFPSHDPELLKESVIEMVIQVNGKVRAKIMVDASDSKNEEKVIAQAKQSLLERGIAVESKFKMVPGRLVNFVVSQAEVGK